MLGLIAIILGGSILVLAMIAIAWVVGMRRKSPTVRRIMRGFIRTFVNPRMMKRAGKPGAHASVIHHVGRTTGRPYQTPLVAEPTDDGFVIALPYGTTSNWVKNVLASGSATILDEGVTYPVGHPELVPFALMADRFPTRDRRNLERFKVDQCLRLRRVDPTERVSEAGGIPEMSLLRS